MILSKRFFHKFIAPIRGAVEWATQRYDSDKCYRVLFARPHVNLHLFFQLSGCKSQRDLAQELEEDQNLQKVVGYPSVNHSSLSRASARWTFPGLPLHLPCLVPEGHELRRPGAEVLGGAKAG